MLILSLIFQYPTVVSTVRLPFLGTKLRMSVSDEGSSASPVQHRHRLSLFGIRGGMSDDDTQPTISQDPNISVVDEDLSGDTTIRVPADIDDDEDILEQEGPSSEEEESERQLKVLESIAMKRQHSSDMILQLTERIPEGHKSMELRKLIISRTEEYISDLWDAVDNDSEKLPHPKKLLHFLAAKVPAIKHSPDVNLRIHSARADVDSGIAACIIGVLGHTCELYDKQSVRRSGRRGEVHRSAAADIRKDRRFEQLVECIISGVKLSKTKNDDSDDVEPSESIDIEHLLDSTEKQVAEGIIARDCCRAVWGMAILGVSTEDEIADTGISDLYVALSNRVCELLVSRLQLLRGDGLFSDVADTIDQSTEDRLSDVSEELAEDAASSMWAFACLKALTGIKRLQLFETSCSILCQDPIDLRRRAQEVDDEGRVSNIGENDVVERLARSENANRNSEHMEVKDFSTGTDDKDSDSKDALLDWLSPNEVNDVLWSLAMYGSHPDAHSGDSFESTATATALGEIAFDRVFEWLEADLSNVVLAAERLKRDVEESRSLLAVEDDAVSIEVVDAAALLASEQDMGAVFEQPVLDKVSAIDGSVAVQEVQLVDAAELLASTAEDEIPDPEVEFNLTDVNQDTQEKDTETETSSSFGDDLHLEYGEGRGERDQEAIPERFIPPPVFSIHDLTRFARSATEIRDSLSNQIVGLVLDIIHESGYSSVKELQAGDLADLAWAISRREASFEGTRQSEPHQNKKETEIFRWISRAISERLVSTDLTILKCFEPPELSRLVWAMACTLSTFSAASDTAKNDDFVRNIVNSALLATLEDVSLFSTEDLVR